MPFNLTATSNVSETLRINILLLVFLFFSLSGISAQQAELTVNVFDPLDNAASGTVTVTGPETSMEKELISGTAIFLLKGMSDIEYTGWDNIEPLYPNPVGSDGRAILELPSLEGRIEVFNIFGRKIGEGRAGDMELSFPFAPGIGIILYTTPDGERAVFKLVNPSSHNLSLTIRRNESFRFKSTGATEGYHIAYTDMEQDLSDISSIRKIYEGTHFTENFYPPYSLKKSTITGKTSGLSLVLVKNPMEEIIGFYETGKDGKIASFSLTDSYSKKTGEYISVTITGYNADTLLLNEHINPGDTITIDSLLTRYYSLKVTCSTLGFNFTVADDDGFLGSGTSQTLFKKAADSLYVDITGSASGYKTSRIENKLIKPGLTWYSMILTPADSIFKHTLTVRLTSSEASEGHSVLNPYIDITSSVGTNRKLITGGSVVYTWDSDVRNESVTYDIGMEGTGHKDLPAASLTVGTTAVSVDKVAEANDWTSNLTLNVKNSKTGTNVSGATVTTSQSKTGTTNTSGNASLNGYVMNENAYSEAINTTINYTISRTDYVDTTGSIALHSGENALNVTLRPVPAYTHSLRINLISNEAGEGHKVKDCPVTFTTSLGTTTVATNNQTITHTWTSKLINETVSYDINVAGGGHADVEAKNLSVGTTLVIENITLIGNDFTGNITFTVKDSETNENINGASITTSQGKTGTTGTAGSVTITGYAIDENEYSEEIGTPVDYRIELTGYDTKSDTADILAGSNTINEILTPEGATTYSHSLTVNLISDEAGEEHKVKDSPVEFTTSLGTGTYNTSGQTYTYTWTSEVETESVTYTIHVTGGGHADSLDAYVNVGTTPVIRNVILKGNDYTGNIAFNVKDSETGLNIEGVAIGTSQSKSGTTNASGNLTLTGYIIGENEFSEATDTAVSYMIANTGYTTKNGSINMVSGNNAVNEKLTPNVPAYSHILTVNLISDEAGHEVKDSPISFTTSLGTSILTTSIQTVTHTWTSEMETENVFFDISVTGSGHADSLDANASVGTTPVTRNITLAGKDYTGNISFNVKDSDTEANIEGAAITTAQDKSGSTDASGNLTLTGYVINENTYSEPVATNITYTIEKDGYTEKSDTANISEGENAVNATLSHVPPTYLHSLTITLISDEAGEGHYVKDSPIEFTTSLGTETHTTSGRTYTFTWTSTIETESVTYDITVTGGGHTNITDASVEVGTTSVNEDVTLVGNDYTGNISFHVSDGAGIDISGASIITDQSKNRITDGNGDALINGYTIYENQYSEPDTTTINYTITATGYVTKTGHLNITAGGNNVNEILVAP
jgi:hypothetical protein